MTSRPATPRRDDAFEILAQPDDTTCGPTCLHAVYQWFGDPVPLETVIAEVPVLDTGGTLGANLACHALRRGWDATLYTWNLSVFDPTWFTPRPLPPEALAGRLRAQREAKDDPRLRAASDAYLEVLRLGGRIRYEGFGVRLLERLLAGGPVITGLSATYLYDCMRELGDHHLVDDDVRGVPSGHFVVLASWDPVRREIRVADPWEDRPGAGSRVYPVDAERVMAAILLGVLTYDATIAVVRPPRSS